MTERNQQLIYEEIEKLSKPDNLKDEQILNYVKDILLHIDELILNHQEASILTNLFEYVHPSQVELRVLCYELMLALLVQQEKVINNEQDSLTLTTTSSTSSASLASNSQLNGMKRQYHQSELADSNNSSIFLASKESTKIKQSLNDSMITRDWIWDFLLRALLKDLVATPDNGDIVIEALRVIPFMQPVRFMAFLRTRGVDFLLKNCLNASTAPESVRITAVRILGPQLISSWLGLQGPAPMLISLLLPTAHHNGKSGRMQSSSGSDMQKSIFVTPSSFESSGELANARQDAEDRIIEIWKIIVLCICDDPSDLVASEAFKSVNILIEPTMRAAVKRNDEKQLFHALKPRLDIESSASGGAIRRLLIRLFPQLLPNIRLIIARATWLTSLLVKSDNGLPMDVINALLSLEEVSYYPGLYSRPLNKDDEKILKMQSSSSSSLSDINIPNPKSANPLSTFSIQDIETLSNQIELITTIVSAIHVSTRLCILNIRQFHESSSRGSIGLPRPHEADNIFIVSNHSVKISTQPGTAISSGGSLKVSPVQLINEYISNLITPMIQPGSSWSIYIQLCAMESCLLLLKSLQTDILVVDQAMIISGCIECACRHLEIMNNAVVVDTLTADLQLRLCVVLLNCLKFPKSMPNIQQKMKLAGTVIAEALSILSINDDLSLPSLKLRLSIVKEAIACAIHTSSSAVLKFIDLEILESTGTLYHFWMNKKGTQSWIREYLVITLIDEFIHLYKTRKPLLDPKVSSASNPADHSFDSIALSLLERIIYSITWKLSTHQLVSKPASASFVDLFCEIFYKTALRTPIDREYLSRVTEDLMPLVVERISDVESQESRIRLLWICVEFILAQDESQDESSLCTKVAESITKELIRHSAICESVGIGFYLLMQLGRRCNGKYTAIVENQFSSIGESEQLMKNELIQQSIREGMKKLLEQLPSPDYTTKAIDRFASLPPQISFSLFEITKQLLYPQNSSNWISYPSWGSISGSLTEKAELELDPYNGDDASTVAYTPSNNVDGLIQHEISGGSDPIHILGQVTTLPSENMLIVWIRIFNMATRHFDNTDITFSVSIAGPLIFWSGTGNEIRHNMHGEFGSKSFMDWVFPLKLIDINNLSPRGISLKVIYTKLISGDGDANPSSKQVISNYPTWFFPDVLFLKPLLIRLESPLMLTQPTIRAEEFNNIWSSLSHTHYIDAYWTGKDLSSCVNDLCKTFTRAMIPEMVLSDACQYGFASCTLSSMHYLFIKIMACLIEEEDEVHQHQHEEHDVLDGNNNNNNKRIRRWTLSIEFRSDSNIVITSFPYLRFLQETSKDFCNGLELIQHGMKPLHSLLPLFDGDCFRDDGVTQEFGSTSFSHKGGNIMNSIDTSYDIMQSTSQFYIQGGRSLQIQNEIFTSPSSRPTEIKKENNHGLDNDEEEEYYDDLDIDGGVLFYPPF